MASISAQVFSTSDRFLIRLRKISEVGSTRALLKVLRWLNPDWKPHTSFMEYLKTKKVSMKDFKNAIKTHQKNILRKDYEGKYFDVSLLYVLIQWGSEGLADKNDKVWQKESDELEYLITAVKNVRNDLMHRYDSIDASEFLQRTDKLRSLLKDMLTKASNVSKNISQMDVDQTIHELNSLINEIRDAHLDPKDFEDYKNQLLFSQQCCFVKLKGAIALRNRHGKYSSLTPASLLAKLKFPVDEVFTDMIIKDSSNQTGMIELVNLLEAQLQGSADDMIFVEGEAGVGKTTLTKKLLSDWTKEKSEIKHLESYDLVIHAECREHIECFKALLDSSMSEVCKSFQGEDIVFVVLYLKCLIIIDGLDELNRKSTKLFQEILKFKKDYDVTVLVTSRPEAFEKFSQYTRSYQLDFKHIKLLGIPSEKREDFVTKYFDRLEKTGLTAQSIDELLKYLKRTEHRLGYLWRSPYNLSILTILWALKPEAVNSITTAPELHWQIHQLSLSKLKERLLNNEITQHLSSSQLERKINFFINVLCQESLVALANDDITLPQAAYNRLADACNDLELPIEEMIGAFLKRIDTHSGIRYSFPHKGLQDFLAAHFIWMRLTASLLSSDVQRTMKEVKEVLSKNSIPMHVCKCILRFTEGELIKESSQDALGKSLLTNEVLITEGIDDFLVEKDVSLNVRQNVIRFIENELKQPESDHTSLEQHNLKFENVDRIIESVKKVDGVPEELQQAVSKMIYDKFIRNPGDTISSLARAPTKGTSIASIIVEETSLHGLLPEMSKFQNMFVSLLGIFFIDESGNVKEETKMEALILLQKTGVKDKDAWLNILNSVKCDTFVANFISQQPHILEGDIVMTDTTLFAYISLLDALEVNVNSTSTVCITLDVKGDLAGADNLLKLISLHQCKVKSIQMYDNNVDDYSRLLRSLTTPLKDAHEVIVDLEISGDLLRISELLCQIKRNNFSARTLKVKDGRIEDSNLNDYCLVLKSLPPFVSSVCVMSFEFCIGGILPDEILQAIRIRLFKLSSILVTEKNVLQYIELLKDLITNKIALNEVNIDIKQNGNASLCELMHQIKMGMLCIRTMSVKDFQINDSNMKVS